MALFLIGTDDKSNDLNYEHISLAFPMASMNWDMLNYVKKSIDPPNENETADWIDGIIVAMDYLKKVECVSNYKQYLPTFQSAILFMLSFFC